MRTLLLLLPRPKPCPEDDPSYRAIQCSNYDHLAYKGENHTWLPVQIKSKIESTADRLKRRLERAQISHTGAPCQLHCKPRDQFFSVLLSDSVVDGTPCNPGTRDMCINGVCRVSNAFLFLFRSFARRLVGLVWFLPATDVRRRRGWPAIGASTRRPKRIAADSATATAPSATPSAEPTPNPKATVRT